MACRTNFQAQIAYRAEAAAALVEAGYRFISDEDGSVVAIADLVFDDWETAPRQSACGLSSGVEVNNDSYTPHPVSKEDD